MLYTRIALSCTRSRTSDQRAFASGLPHFDSVIDPVYLRFYRPIVAWALKTESVVRNWRHTPAELGKGEEMVMDKQDLPMAPWDDPSSSVWEDVVVEVPEEYEELVEHSLYECYRVPESGDVASLDELVSTLWADESDL